MARALKFEPRMLNGKAGNVTSAVKRVIVRGVNHDLVVTSTTGGVHALFSFHKPRPPLFPLGRAVDMAGPREKQRDFQRDLIQTHGAHSFNEIFGPDNEWNVKNGVKIALGEGTPLEEQHDNANAHVHVAPRLVIPLPKPTRRQIEARKARRRRRRQEQAARKAGARFVDITFDAAEEVGLSKAAALALLDIETGFENEYGHDEDPSTGKPVWHGKSGKVLVTATNYREYRRFARRTGKHQGAGPPQLTAEFLQAEADRKGGGHRPEVSIPVGLAHLAALIRKHGTFVGAGAFNGGEGNPNEVYARKFIAARDRWQRVLT